LATRVHLNKKNINLLKKNKLIFLKKKQKKKEEKRAGLGWLGHPQPMGVATRHPPCPIFVFSFFFCEFYFLINLYYFIKIGHVSTTCHQ
jgi:hypothetical protein